MASVNRFFRAALCITVLVGSMFSFGQTKKGIQYSGFFDSYYYRGPLSFTLGGGIGMYNGDLCGGPGCNKIGPGVSIGANYKLWPRVRFGAEFNYSQLGAKDNNTIRNISFTGTVMELMAYGHYYVFEDLVRRHADLKAKPIFFKPYLKVGLSGIYYNASPTKADSSGAETAVNEGKKLPAISFTLPLGVGTAFVLSHRFSILTELVGRYTFTDYLDGISTVNGNPGSKDMFGTFVVKLQYSPTAPRLKKKKKVLHGPIPSNGTGGGSGGGSAPASGGGGSGGGSAPAGESTPDAPAEEEYSLPEAPAEEAPAPDSGEGEYLPAEDKPADKPAENSGGDSSSDWD